MSNQQQQLFSIKCQCSAFRNDILITSKKKSKLSNLVLNPHNKILSIVPLNSKEQNIQFELKKLKNIHRKFIGEGKITLQFSQQTDRITPVNQISSEQNKTERLSRIFVEAASPQNLQLLIKKIIETKKFMKSQTKSLGKKQFVIQKEHMMKQTSEQQCKSIVKSPIKKMISNKQKSQRYNQNPTNKKRNPLLNEHKSSSFQNQKNEVKISRKALMSQILQSQKNKHLPIKPILIKHQKTINYIDILELPCILLVKIFQYTKVQLKYRLINKKFDKFVLQNVKIINFKDQVDTQTFNKLGKYVPNLKGRLKNVRSVQLIDLYDEPQLQRDRAKCLYFGQWKQISKKNILQIKGLRIHTLEIPYHIKFQFQNIYGIKLKQLHLCSKYEVTTGNLYITDQNIIYLFKHIVQLQAISIPYINSSVLQQLSNNMKQKVKQMKYLRFGSINQNSKKQQSWYLFHIYQQLKHLSVQRILKGGLLRKDVRYKFTFPLFIQQLQIGSFVSQQTIRSFPTTLLKLKLMGQIYFNNDVSNIFLPYLKYLDIRECPMIRPSVVDLLEKCSNLKIITNWEKEDIDYWREMASDKGIEIISMKGVIMKR